MRTLRVCYDDENIQKGAGRMTRLEQQLRFIVEIDKIKQIGRQTYLSDGSRKENDAEHSWHIALMAYLLQEHAEEEVRPERVVPMLLIHDLVEIDAGDTYAYDETGKATQHEREKKAAERIFGLLPKEQKGCFMDLWEEFEAYETADAKYAHLLDNLQPLLLNAASDGKSWKEHQVRKEQICKRNEKVPETSHVIWEHMQTIIDEYVRKGMVLE